MLMRVDHTKHLEKRIEAIHINFLDGCSFYAPKEGSLLVVHLCAYCKFGEFEEKNKNGFCKYRLECSKEKRI